MLGIRYLDVNNLPPDMPKENRAIVRDLHRTTPTPTLIRMVYPQWYFVNDTTLAAFGNSHNNIPENIIKELRLLKREDPYETREDFLLQVEKRIGQEARGTYEDILCKCAISPLAGQLVPAEIQQLATGALEDLIKTVHAALSRIAVRNSGTCQCWIEYQLFKERRLDIMDMFTTGGNSYGTGKRLIEQAHRLLDTAALLQSESSTVLAEQADRLIERGTALIHEGGLEAGKTLSKTAFEKKLADLDRVMRQQWKDDVPYRFAESIDEPKCPYCKNYRELNESLALLTPSFVHDLLNITIGGELPLASIIPFAQAVFDQIYNPDMIPESKKKAVAAFTEKIQLQRILSAVIEKILGILGLSTLMDSIGDLTQKTSQVSTDTLQISGSLPQMKLTEDFLPVSEIGSTTNMSKEENNSETS